MPSFKTSIVVLFAASQLAVASPAPFSNEVNNAYSGSAGDASGGSVYPESNHKSGLLAGIIGKGGLRGLGLVNILSNNGGDGGHANSGPTASSPGRGSVSFSGPPNHGASNSNSVGNSFSGTGGDTSGGSVYGGGGIINVLSNNGGDGGEANSGSAGLKNPPAWSKPRRLSSRIMRPRFL